MAIDAGTSRDRQADHVIAVLRERWSLAPRVAAATHLERGDDARVIVTLDFVGASTPSSAADAAADIAAIVDELDVSESRATVAVFDDGGDRTDWAGPSAGLLGVERAEARRRQRTGGRLVVFPGCDGLRGVLPVADLLAHSAIDRLAPVGGVHVSDDALVNTQSFVRPQWRHGELLLDVVPIAGGMLAPFEVPNPTPCCADHA
jgi:hypothetical protein